MILQALTEYYQRKAADPDSGIAPLGWEWKELPFLIVLKADGTLLNIEDTREGEGKNRRARRFLVPQAVKRTVGIASNLLWDNPDYALGFYVPPKGRTKADRSAESHAAFLSRIAEVGLTEQSSAVSAVLSFLARDTKIAELAAFDDLWEEISTTGPFISFKLAGDMEPVFRDPVIINAINAQVNATSGTKSLCIVTGNEDQFANLHPVLKGISGANATGANIVGYNAPAFCSFGKQQGENAPVGQTAAFAYTTALNSLLNRDSGQRLMVGDTTTVFWSARQTAFEDAFDALWSEPPKDNPDRLTDAVATLFKSVSTGAFVTDNDNTEFYVLGLSPNAARVGIRFWHHGTVANMAANIRQYFDDMRIIHPSHMKQDLPLGVLLRSTARKSENRGDWNKNINPNLAGATMRAIIEGLAFPETLFQATVIRIKAERDVSYPRAKIIKACLNRKLRSQPNLNERRITMSLDKENTNIGYRLGRLFATLEKIQQEANPGINATIRDKFYAAASSAPATVFGTLMRLKNFNLSKLESTGRRIWFEKLLGEVMEAITDFPSHLALADQGRFAIGYYHQNQDFWTKKTDKPQND